MPTTLNVNDRNALERSLEYWRVELAKERKAAGAVVTHREARGIREARAIIARREAQIRRLPGPRGKAVKAALRQVGVSENPPGSNWGTPYPAGFLHLFGSGPNPWCGAFAGWACERGGANVSPRILYTPYIFDDAAHGRNGLERVVWHDGFTGERVAHSGALVLFDFGSGGIKHVELLRAPWKGSGPLKTVGGNTSSDEAGSQDNGGCVARKSRDVSLVHSIVDVRWP